MRKKITIGFLSLALLLLFTGVVAVYELGRLKMRTHEIIEQAMNNPEETGPMLTRLQARSSAIISETITSCIIAVVVAIFLVLLFLFFMDIGYAIPLRKINKGLKGYLETRIPFNDSFQSSEEITSLKEMISGLIEQSKKNKP